VPCAGVRSGAQQAPYKERSDGVRTDEKDVAGFAFGKAGGLVIQRRQRQYSVPGTAEGMYVAVQVET
jgi:hypothetical protein